MWKRNLLISMAILIFFQAISLVYIRYMNRLNVAELSQLQQQRDVLNTQWAQLLLEHSTLSAHSRIEHIAREKLGMSFPDENQTLWINP